MDRQLLSLVSSGFSLSWIFAQIGLAVSRSADFNQIFWSFIKKHRQAYSSHLACTIVKSYMYILIKAGMDVLHLHLIHLSGVQHRFSIIGKKYRLSYGPHLISSNVFNVTDNFQKKLRAACSWSNWCFFCGLHHFHCYFHILYKLGICRLWTIYIK